MNLTAEQNHLQSLLAKVIGVVNKRNTIPILSNVLLTATDKLKATATDLDTEVTASVLATVITPGETTVSAELLNGIVMKLPKGSLVTIEHDGQFLHVSAGRSKFKLATLNATDYPAMASSDYQSTIEFQGLELKNAIEKTAWAASTEETRYYLNGIAMQYVDGKANFIATDGHRLAWYVDGEAPTFPSVIVPSKTAKIFKDLLDAGTATVQVSETKVKLTFGDVSVVSKVIDGTYPDWGRIIPKDNANSVTMPSTDAKQAIERVIIVATERTKAVGLSIKGGELTFKVNDPTGGTAAETLATEQIGLDAELGVNSKYAIDAFAQADKGDVTIHYNGAIEAMLIKYDKEPKLTVVTMPMRA